MTDLDDAGSGSGPRKRGLFDWLGLLTKFLVALTPLAVALFGAMYSSALKEREVRAQFVEISLEILRQDTNSTAPELRAWATEVIDSYSGVRLSPEAREDLLRRPLISYESALVFVTSEIPGSFESGGIEGGTIEIGGIEDSEVLGLKVREAGGELASRDRLGVGEAVTVARGSARVRIVLRSVGDGVAQFRISPGSG